MTRSTSTDPARLIWILYDPARARKGAALIERIGRSIPLDGVVVVWNGSGAVPTEATTVRTGPAVEIVRGSNRGREFGGYQDGLDHLRRSAGGGVFFLNDTAGVHNYLPDYFFDSLTSAALRLRNQHGVCVGHVDRALEVLEIDGLSASSWVRSNLFYLDAPALDALAWKVHVPEIDALIIGESPEAFYASRLNATLRRRLDRWLFVPGRRSWYGAAALTVDNVAFMAGKARSVLQEYYLSMRVAHAGLLTSSTDMSPLQRFWLKLVNRLGRETGRLR